MSPQILGSSYFALFDKFLDGKILVETYYRKMGESLMDLKKIVFEKELGKIFWAMWSIFRETFPFSEDIELFRC